MTPLFEVDDQTTEGKKLIEFLSSLKFVKKVTRREVKLSQAEEDKALFAAMEAAKDEKPLSKEEQDSFIDSLGK